jgi:integrase
VRPVTPMSMAEMRSLLSNHSPLATMIALAFLGGQRLGDVIQLSPNDLLLTNNRLLVTIRRGKVIGRIGPFTISLPRTRAGVQCPVVLRVEKMLATHQREPYILTTANTEAERARVAEQATSLLKSINPSLESRSVRRGGLTRLAEAGAPVETILLYSRHASLAMLYRYLDAGRLCSAHHQQQDAAQEKATHTENSAQQC